MKHVWPTRLDGVTSYQFQRYLVADQGSAQCVKLPIDFCRQLSSLLKNAHVSKYDIPSKFHVSDSTR